jgi:hypothetical protein
MTIGSPAAPSSSAAPSQSFAPPSGAPQAPANPQAPQAPQAPHIDNNAIMMQEREAYRQRQLAKKERMETERLRNEMPKPKSIDDIFAELINEKKPVENKEAELEARIKEQVKQEMMEEQRQQREQEEMEMGEKQTVENFQNFVGSKLEQMAERYPLSSSTGMHGQIAQAIMSEMVEIEDTYGEEYGEKWLRELDYNKYFQKYEQNMAGNLQKMLSNPHVANLVKRYLGGGQGQQPQRPQQPQYQQQRTISQDDLGGGIVDYKSMSFDERVELAKRNAREGR